MKEHEVSIQKITETNRWLLQNVAHDVFDYEIDEARLTQYLKQTNHVMYVAIVDGVVVGQARGLLQFHSDMNLELYVDNLGVASERRRKGIATRLISALKALADEKFCRSVFVMTESDNNLAKDFYNSFGREEQKAALFELDLNKT